MDLKDLEFKEFLEICIDREHPLHRPAWYEFDRRYRQVILGKIRKVTRNHDDVEEITEQVLTRLIVKDFRTLRNFRGDNDEYSFITYLGIISHRIAIDFVKLPRHKREVDLLEEIIATTPEHDPEEIHGELLELFQKAYAQRSKRRYNVERDILMFFLRKLFGFRAKEVASLPIFRTKADNVDTVINRMLDDIKSLHSL